MEFYGEWLWIPTLVQYHCAVLLSGQMHLFQKYIFSCITTVKSELESCQSLGMSECLEAPSGCH